MIYTILCKSIVATEKLSVPPLMRITASLFKASYRHATSDKVRKLFLGKEPFKERLGEFLEWGTIQQRIEHPLALEGFVFVSLLMMAFWYFSLDLIFSPWFLVPYSLYVSYYLWRGFKVLGVTNLIRQNSLEGKKHIFRYEEHTYLFEKLREDTNNYYLVKPALPTNIKDNLTNYFSDESDDYRPQGWVVKKASSSRFKELTFIEHQLNSKVDKSLLLFSDFLSLDKEIKRMKVVLANSRTEYSILEQESKHLYVPLATMIEQLVVKVAEYEQVRIELEKQIYICLVAELETVQLKQAQLNQETTLNNLQATLLEDTNLTHIKDKLQQEQILDELNKEAK